MILGKIFFLYIFIQKVKVTPLNQFRELQILWLFPARSSDTGTAGTGIEILGFCSAHPLQESETDECKDGKNASLRWSGHSGLLGCAQKSQNDEKLQQQRLITTWIHGGRSKIESFSLRIVWQNRKRLFRNLEGFITPNK